MAAVPTLKGNGTGLALKGDDVDVIVVEFANSLADVLGDAVIRQEHRRGLGEHIAAPCYPRIGVVECLCVWHGSPLLFNTGYLGFCGHARLSGYGGIRRFHLVTIVLSSTTVT